jgi:hypothetical protein
MESLQIHMSADTDCKQQCEGMVVTCAHCGRPACECDGTNCERVLETGDWMVPGYTRDPKPTEPSEHRHLGVDRDLDGEADSRVPSALRHRVAGVRLRANKLEEAACQRS